MQYLEILTWLHKLKQANLKDSALLKKLKALDEVLLKTEDAQQTLDAIVNFLTTIVEDKIHTPNMLTPDLIRNQLLADSWQDTFRNTFNLADKEVFNLFVGKRFVEIGQKIEANLSSGKQDKEKLEQNIRWYHFFGDALDGRHKIYGEYAAYSFYWLSLLNPTAENILKAVNYFVAKHDLNKDAQKKNTYALLDLIARNSSNFTSSQKAALREPLEQFSREYLLQVVQAGCNNEYKDIVQFDRLNLLKNFLDESSPLGARMKGPASSDSFFSGFTIFRNQIEDLFLKEPQMDDTQLGVFYLELYVGDLVKNSSAATTESTFDAHYYRQKARGLLDKKSFHYLAAKALYEANSPIEFVSQEMSKHADKCAGVKNNRTTVNNKTTPEQLVLLGKINIRKGDYNFALSVFFSNSKKFKFDRNEMAPLLDEAYSNLPEARQKKFRDWIKINVASDSRHIALLPTVYETYMMEVNEEKRVEEEKRITEALKIEQDKQAAAERERQAEEARFAREEESKRIAHERQLERERQIAQDQRLSEERARLASEERLAAEEAQAVKTIDKAWSNYESAVSALQINGLECDDTTKPKNVNEVPALNNKTATIKQIMIAHGQCEALKIVSLKVLGMDELSESPLLSCMHVDELTQSLLKRITEINQTQESQLIQAGRTLKQNGTELFKTLNALEKEISKLNNIPQRQDLQITTAVKDMEVALVKKPFDATAFLNSYEILKQQTENLPERITNATTQKNELSLALKEQAEEKQRAAQAKAQAQLEADAKKKADGIWGDFEKAVASLREQGYVGDTEDRPGVDEQDKWKGLEKWIGRCNTLIISMKQWQVLDAIFTDLELENNHDNPLKSCDGLGDINANLFKKIKDINEKNTKSLRNLAQALREKGSEKSKQLATLQKEISHLEKQSEQLAQPTKSIHLFQQVLSNYAKADETLVKASANNTLDESFSKGYLALQKSDNELTAQVTLAKEIKEKLTQGIAERVAQLSEEDNQLKTACTTYANQFKASLKDLEAHAKTMHAQLGNHGVISRANLVGRIKSLQDTLSDITHELALEDKQVIFSSKNLDFNRIVRMRKLVEKCGAFVKTNPLEATLIQLDKQVNEYVDARQNYLNEAKSIGETLFNTLESAKTSFEKDALKNDKTLTTQVEKLFATIKLNDNTRYLSFFAPNPWDEVYTKEKFIAQFSVLANSDNPLNLKDIKKDVDVVSGVIQQKIAEQHHVEIKQPEAIQKPVLVQAEVKLPQPQVAKAQETLQVTPIKQPKAVEDKKDFVAANDPSMPDNIEKQTGWLDWLIRRMTSNSKTSQEVLPKEEHKPSVQPDVQKQSDHAVYIPEDYGVSASEFSPKKQGLLERFVTWLKGIFASEEELPQQKSKETSLPRQEITPKSFPPLRQQGRPIRNNMRGEGRAKLDDDNQNTQGPRQ